MDKLFFDYGRGQPWIAMDNEDTHHKFLNFLTPKMQPLLTTRRCFRRTATHGTMSALRPCQLDETADSRQVSWAGVLCWNSLQPCGFVWYLWKKTKNEGIIVAHFHTRPNIQSLVSTSRDRQETSAEGSLFWQRSSQEKRRTWYASNRKQEAKGGDQVSFQSSQDHFILMTLMIVALSRVLLVWTISRKKNGILQSATQIFSRFTDQLRRNKLSNFPSEEGRSTLCQSKHRHIRTTATIARKDSCTKEVSAYSSVPVIVKKNAHRAASALRLDV